MLLTLYVLHARRVTPIRSSISGCCSIDTFRAGVIGGSLFRIGVGAVPFLLPLMLQLGFGLDALPVGPADLCRGRRRADDEDSPRRRSSSASASASVLIVNGVLGAPRSPPMALFTPDDAVTS